jgi:hypothetical protein
MNVIPIKTISFFLAFICLLTNCISSPTSQDQRVTNASIAQSRETNGFDSCEFLVTTAFPQLLVGRNINPSQMSLISSLAVNQGYILENGKVIDHAAVADIALVYLGRTEISLSFNSIPASVPEEEAKLVGFINEILDQNMDCHYTLAGIDGQTLYNPCNVKGIIKSSIKVFVFARN